MKEKTDNECPSNDFDKGVPSGKCFGDGHYRCLECKHYREDFKRLGQDFIDFCHVPVITITSL
jgi:hypothetical protein